MYEELTPTEKVRRHGSVKAFFLLISSFFGTLWFVGTLSFGALISHIYQVITGKEKGAQGSEPANGYVPRKAFPNLENMKKTKDLRYYALELGLDLEEYTITTEDGYVLVLHHLIDPKETILDRQKKKPILLQHGLLSCSGAYITSGTNSLGYYLWEHGYDVWLGNNRAHFEPKHTYYTGNLFKNELYWDWDIRNLAYYDLPCIIDNILAHKPNHDKLVLVGHSQGCTQSFLLLLNGNLSRYHEKIEIFFPLAPAIFPGSLFQEKWFLKFLHNRSPTGFRALFGLCSFLKVVGSVREHLATTRLFQFNAYILYKFLFGWNAKKWSKSQKVRHFNAIFNVTYVSSRLMTWWLGYYTLEGFANQVLPREDYKKGKNYEVLPAGAHVKTARGLGDAKTFFPYTRSWFDKVKNVPIHLFAGDNDHLVDGNRIIAHLRNYEPTYKEGVNLEIVQLDDYDHCDFIWAEDLNGRIGTVIVDRLSKLEAESGELVEQEVDEKVEPVEKEAVPSSFNQDNEEEVVDEKKIETIKDAPPALLSGGLPGGEDVEAITGQKPVVAKLDISQENGTKLSTATPVTVAAS